MSMSDYAIEQEEERYQEYTDKAQRDYLQEMEDNHLHDTEEDNLFDNLVDDWFVYQAEERDECLFLEVV